MTRTIVLICDMGLLKYFSNLFLRFILIEKETQSQLQPVKPHPNFKFLYVMVCAIDYIIFFHMNIYKNLMEIMFDYRNIFSH